MDSKKKFIIIISSFSLSLLIAIIGMATKGWWVLNLCSGDCSLFRNCVDAYIGLTSYTVCSSICTPYANSNSVCTSIGSTLSDQYSSSGTAAAFFGSFGIIFLFAVIAICVVNHFSFKIGTISIDKLYKLYIILGYLSGAFLIAAPFFYLFGTAARDDYYQNYNRSIGYSFFLTLLSGIAVLVIILMEKYSRLCKGPTPEPLLGDEYQK